MSGPMRLLFGLKVFFSGLHFLQDQLGFFGGFVGDYYIGGCGDLFSLTTEIFSIKFIFTCMYIHQIDKYNHGFLPLLLLALRFFRFPAVIAL